MGSESCSQLLRLYGDNAVAIMFNGLKQTIAFSGDDDRLDLLQRLNQVPLISIPDSATAGEPWIPLTVLADPETRAGFLEAIGWAADRVAAAAGRSAES